MGRNQIDLHSLFFPQLTLTFQFSWHSETYTLHGMEWQWFWVMKWWRWTIQERRQKLWLNSSLIVFRDLVARSPGLRRYLGKHSHNIGWRNVMMCSHHTWDCTNFERGIDGYVRCFKNNNTCIFFAIKTVNFIALVSGY